MERLRSKKSFPEAIMEMIFETKSSSHIKYSTAGKVKFLFFKSFFASIDTFFVLGGRLSTKL